MDGELFVVVLLLVLEKRDDFLREDIGDDVVSLELDFLIPRSRLLLL